MSDDNDLQYRRIITPKSRSDIVKEFLRKLDEVKLKPRLNRPEHYGCETFEIWHPSGEAREIIDRACIIIDDIGGNVTLRQVYYQFVSRGWLENKQREYNRLGKIISRARKAGLIRWNVIVDRTRSVKDRIDYDAPTPLSEYANDALEHIRYSADGLASRYQVNPWATQPNYIQVWVEKDALVGVVADACRIRGGIPYLSCRGFTSDTVVYEAAQKMKEHLASGLNVVVLHLGDHDPSGMQMTADITDKLRWGGHN
jgi:hypothetical protein